MPHDDIWLCTGSICHINRWRHLYECRDITICKFFYCLLRKWLQVVVDWWQLAGLTFLRSTSTLYFDILLLYTVIIDSTDNYVNTVFIEYALGKTMRLSRSKEKVYGVVCRMGQQNPIVFRYLLSILLLHTIIGQQSKL